MIVWFLSNISAKYYKYLSMLSRVIAKNVGDVFLRHSVYIIYWFFVLHFRHIQYGSDFNHFNVIGSQSYRTRWNNAK